MKNINKKNFKHMHSLLPTKTVILLNTSLNPNLVQEKMNK